MVCEEKPSERVILQRIRNRIIEYLETASSYEEQRDCQRKVPHVHVPNEIIEQWNDWVGPKWRDSYGAPVFSQAEQAAIDRFHVVWVSVIAETPRHLPPLEGLIQTSPWEYLRVAAAEALTVFIERGKFSEEREIV